MGRCSHGRDGVGRQRQMDDRTDKKQTRKVDTPCLSSLSHPHLPTTPHIHLFFRGVRRWYAHWILGICKDIVPYFCMWNPLRPSLNGLFGCSIQEFTSFGQRWVGGWIFFSLLSFILWQYLTRKRQNRNKVISAFALSQFKTNLYAMWLPLLLPMTWALKKSSSIFHYMYLKNHQINLVNLHYALW